MRMHLIICAYILLGCLATNQEVLSLLQASAGRRTIVQKKAELEANAVVDIDEAGTEDVDDVEDRSGLGALPEVCDATKCVQKKDCSLNFHKVVQNNLGGVGPDTGAAELRYDSICDVNGDKIDMVVTALTPYAANNAAKNGISGLYGNINLLGGTKVDLKFQFVKSGTLEPVPLPTTDLTMFDMDGKPGVQEVVTASGYDSYTLGLNSSVLQQVLSSTAPTSMFSSTETGYVNERPTDPMQLTPLQERRSFSLKYMDSSSMTVGFEITGSHGDGGRNFVFAGHSTINYNMCTSSAGR